MRAGCAGCLSGIVLFLFIVGATAGAVWAGMRIVSTPAFAASPPSTEPDSSPSQFGEALAGRGRHRRGEIVVSEREFNGLVGRLGIRGPLDSLRVRMLGDGAVEVYGRVRLPSLLPDAPGIERLPASWRARPLWLRFRGPISIENGMPTRLRVRVSEFAVGEQRLPLAVLPYIVGPEILSELAWRVPARIEAIRIEPGRALIRIAS